MPLPQILIDKAADIAEAWANEAVKKLKANLHKSLKQNAQVSLLEQSIVFDGSTISQDGILLTWNLNDYYAYIDLGVKGTRNRVKTYISKDFPAGFKFRNDFAPKSMVDSMQNYIARKGIKLDDVKGKGSNLEKSFIKAKQMSIAVKRKGIEGTRFYSSVFNDAEFQKLTDEIARVVGNEYEIKIIAEVTKL